MKSLTGKFSSVRGWALLLALLLGAGMMISACGEEEVPAPTTPAPAPPPTPTPTPPPEPEPTGPATPENVRVTDKGANYMIWAWDPVEGVDGYNAHFSVSSTFTDTSGLFVLTGADKTSQRYEGLDPNTAGYFRVQAFTGTGADAQRSEWSETKSDTTAPPPAPEPLGAPGDFRTTAQSDNSITLAWNSVDGAASYEVEQQSETGGWVAASCDGGDNEVDFTTCVVTGLDEATDYDFRVKAIPSDSSRNRDSEWVTISDLRTTGTRPAPPPMTVSGGEADLNLIWESEGASAGSASITWIWDQVEDRTRKYEVHYDADIDAYNSKSNPCPEPDATTWADAAASGFATRHTVGSLDPGDVRLLCVQTTWDDDRGVTQYGNHSWAWAATPPVAPSSGAVDDNPRTYKTDAVTWSVTFDQGFTYSLRLVSDDADATATAPDQDACADGHPLPEETSGNRPEFTLTAYDVKSVAYYTTYHLCYRARNDDVGHSEWAVSEAVSTLPPQPSSPSPADSSLTATETSVEWSFRIPDSGHPQEIGSYDFQVITDTDITAKKTAQEKHCEAGTDTDSEFEREDLSGTPTRTREGITVPHTISANSDTTNSVYYYLCVRGDLTTQTGGADRDGRWRVGGRITQAKAPS